MVRAFRKNGGTLAKWGGKINVQRDLKVLKM
jgi:hypothetical protein